MKLSALLPVRNSYRASDIYCRYGGEEFLMLLPGMVHEAACCRTELLRAALEGISIPYGASSIQVTATFGVATYSHHADSRSALIAAADQALYAGKAEGRNRVRRYCKEMGNVQELTSVGNRDECQDCGSHSI
jgi:diguanylate cyclase (GGDEF)-like protein